jgi:hypothetical protein
LLGQWCAERVAPVRSQGTFKRLGVDWGWRFFSLALFQQGGSAVDRSIGADQVRLFVWRMHRMKGALGGAYGLIASIVPSGQGIRVVVNPC